MSDLCWQTPRQMLCQNAPKTSEDHKQILRKLWPVGDKKFMFDRAMLKLIADRKKSRARLMSGNILVNTKRISQEKVEKCQEQERLSDFY